MQITIVDQSFLLSNQTESVDVLFAKLNQNIEESNLRFSHMIIDGTEVYEDHYEYIIDHLKEIQEIVVKLKTEKELMDDLLLSADQYLSRALPEVKQLSNEFYQGPANESWDKFSQLLEAFRWIDDVINLIDGLNNNYSDWSSCVDYSSKLRSEWDNLEGALKNSDLILIADMLTYEIIPLFEALSATISEIIDKEVVPNDIN